MENKEILILGFGGLIVLFLVYQAVSPGRAIQSCMGAILPGNSGLTNGWMNIFWVAIFGLFIYFIFWMAKQFDSCKDIKEDKRGKK